MRCIISGRLFPEVVELLDLRFQHSWRAAFKTQPPRLPRLAFGSWVGGDRDGHPFVTPEVTARTLSLLREGALSVLRERFRELAARLSLDESVRPAPAGLRKRLGELASLLGEASNAAVERNPGEPWRQLINLMLLRLERANGSATEAGGYVSPQDLIEDLEVLEGSLREAGARHIADLDVRPLAAQARACSASTWRLSTFARTAPIMTALSRACCARRASRGPIIRNGARKRNSTFSIANFNRSALSPDLTCAWRARPGMW